MLLKTQAATEVALFLAHHPTSEQIVAFHPSSEVAERAYELIHNDRDGLLTEEERSDLASVDPTTGKAVFLFNPREQKWRRHFRLSGPRIEGITSSGRATIALLHLNDDERVAYRLGLIEIGHYPGQ